MQKVWRVEKLQYFCGVKQTHPEKMTTIQFTRPARLTRNAFRNATAELGQQFYCATVNGQAAFIFPQTSTVVIAESSVYAQFLAHLQCEEGIMQVGRGETPDNWG